MKVFFFAVSIAFILAGCVAAPAYDPYIQSAPPGSPAATAQALLNKYERPNHQPTHSQATVQTNVIAFVPGDKGERGFRIGDKESPSFIDVLGIKIIDDPECYTYAGRPTKGCKRSKRHNRRHHRRHYR